MAKIVLGTDISTATRSSFFTKTVTAPLCIQFSKSADGMLMPPEEPIDLDGATDISEYIFYNAFHNLDSLTGTLKWNSLTKITGDFACHSAFEDCGNLLGVEMDGLEYLEGNGICCYMFRDCINLEYASFKNLKRMTSTGSAGLVSQMFWNCKKLKTVDLSSLVSISGNRGGIYFFQGSGVETINIDNLTTINGDYAGAYFLSGTNIETINIDNLTTINGDSAGRYFLSGTKITSVNFKSLSSIASNNAMYGALQYCQNLTDVYFPALTTNSFGSYKNQFNYLLSDCTGVTLHFASGMQSKISTLSGYPNFRGNSTVIKYDL